MSIDGIDSYFFSFLLFKDEVVLVSVDPLSMSNDIEIVVI
uniref:Uncharacterized protein n=1 Tax=Utricularia reniformis TaxID=192314 RepID=A0A1Y0B4N0_9LAMI|nr:hypothetical protein AEK19_MT2271 [Utricularia reniformis]ART32416.1 hypothetical protein AEK19_MT2271 [Utricularia reniformis]